MNNACPYCDCTINDHQAIRPGHCGKPNCTTSHIVRTTRAAEADKQEIYDKTCARIAQENTPNLTQVATANGLSVDDITVGIVPYKAAYIVPLPDDRKIAFQTHLDQIIADAFDQENAPLSSLMFSRETDGTQEIISAGCTACQGSCCQRGAKNNAFLSADLIRYFCRTTPELTADMVRNTYLNALPDEGSVKDSCVFHGSKGCTLDRNIRANLCNTFSCIDLTFLTALTEVQTKPMIAIIAVDEDSGAGKSIASFSPSLGLQEVTPIS